MELKTTMIASSLAGMSARVFCHPLDTAKARLQAQTTNAADWRSTSNGFRNTKHVLMKTMRVAFWGSAPGTCLYLTSYQVVKERLVLIPGMEKRNFLAHFSAGMLAETISCVFWVPIDVMKERMQVQSMDSADPNKVYKNTLDGFRKILKNEGWRGLYKGYGATLGSFGPFSALYFMFYEKMKTFILQSDTTKDAAFHHLLVCSATAGAMASFCTNPLDLIKLRLQIQRQSSSLPTYTFRECTQQTLRTEGIRGFFKGAGARMLFHAPSTAITMALFEYYKQYIQ